MPEFVESPKPRRSLFEESQDRLTDPPSGVFDHADPETSPVPLRELIALTLIVILCDLSIYRSDGYAGPSLLFVVAPALLCLGITSLKFDKSLWLLTPMLALVSLRLLWCGSGLAVFAGFVLLICVAMNFVGIPPYLRNVGSYTFRLIGSGFRGIGDYLSTLSRFHPAIHSTHVFAVFLPTVTLMVFGTIFIFANPDLVKSVALQLDWLGRNIAQWIQHFEFTEILFCCTVAWIGIGALRPSVSRFQARETAAVDSDAIAESAHYSAYRNTLVSLIALFAVYLVFEFQTLWFRSFPEKFHYSGYAHEGAAWLTVALGLATLTLSLIFREGILTDPRLPKLRVLAWIWSIQNLLLAVAVFNRLFIYIGFNGMTRMRVVGILGVASVVGGFLFVVRKITHNRSFVWLIRRQLWTVSFAVYVYAVLPVDAFVNQFNVNRIMNGNTPPCVQISVHPTSDEGWLCLSPLIHCSDAMIRDGVCAMLSEKLDALDASANQYPDSASSSLTGWTRTQIARNRLHEQLKSLNTELHSHLDRGQRDIAIQEFHKYAYQWY